MIRVSVTYHPPVGPAKRDHFTVRGVKDFRTLPKGHDERDSKAQAFEVVDYRGLITYYGPGQWSDVAYRFMADDEEVA